MKAKACWNSDDNPWGPPGLLMKRGDIVRLDLPDQKQRPAVVISPDFLNDVRNRILIAPCTSQRTDEVAQTEVLLDRQGLPKPTKVQCQDLGTFPKQHLGGKLRSLSPSEQDALDRALTIITGLWSN